MVLGIQDDFATTTSSGMFDTGTVTLTRAQLKAILEAVGQVRGLQLSDDISKPPSCNHPDNPDLGYYPTSESLPFSQSTHNNNNNATEDENLNGFPSVDSRAVASNSLPVSSHHAVSSSGVSPISKLQQKRRQWERERGESEVWSPWGRPGGGAPRNNRRSVVMATVSPTTAGDPLKSQPRGYSGYSCYTSDSLPGSTASGVRVPDFIKSSLPFGPNSDYADEDNLEKKRQWRLELEQQREEQRRRRSDSHLQDPPHQYSSDVQHADRWGFEEEGEDVSPDPQMAAGRYSGMDSPASTLTGTSRTFLRGQNTLPLDPESSSRLQEQRDRALEYQRVIQEQVEEKKRKQAEEKARRHREEELEEQRLEQERELIREQYEKEQQMTKEKAEREERKRQMMEAAVQKARAEAEADKRAKKAQRLNTSSTANNNNDTPSSRNTTPKHHVSPSSRLSLRKNDEPMPEQSLDQRSQQPQPSPISPVSTSPKTQNGVSHQQTATVHPVRSSSQSAHRVPNRVQPLDTPDYPPEEDVLELKEMSAQTDRPLKLPHEPSAYVANRLLTPSVWRTRERCIAAQNAWSQQRDMATQTDQPQTWDDEDDDRSERACSSIDERSSRNTSATSSKRSCAGKGASKSELGNRPVWGVNQPVKSFVKMTDRDPNHSRRKKFQEMRRQHWEREMASLRDQLAVARSRSRVNLSQSTASGTTTTAPVSMVAGMSVSPRLGRTRLGSDSAFQVKKRATSQGLSEKGSERDSAWSSAGSSLYAVSANSLGTTYTTSSNEGTLPTLSRRWSHSNDQVPQMSIPGGTHVYHEEYEEHEPGMDEREGPFFPPVRRKWHSQESFNEATSHHHQQQQQPRPHTPSILIATDDSHHAEERPLLPPPPPSRRKWSEQRNFDPAAVALGRHLVDADSEKGSPDTPPDRMGIVEPGPSQDPLVNPKLVTSRPTPRQDRILQQLSTLRQGLLQKQREIETLVRQPATWTS